MSEDTEDVKTMKWIQMFCVAARKASMWKDAGCDMANALRDVLDSLEAHLKAQWYRRTEDDAKLWKEIELIHIALKEWNKNVEQVLAVKYVNEICD